MRLPINPLEERFDFRTSWVVVGLPNNEPDWIDSDKRNGVGSQIFWWEFFREARISNGDPNEQNEPLDKVVYVDVEKRSDESGIIDFSKHPSYSKRRSQLLRLKRGGLKLTLGARKDDFVTAADAALSADGLLILLTHHETRRGLEFVDGFLTANELAELRQSGGRGLFYAMSCRGAEQLRAFKNALSPSALAVSGASELDTAGALVLLVAFGASLLMETKTFAEHRAFAFHEIERLHGPLDAQHNLRTIEGKINGQ